MDIENLKKLREPFPAHQISLLPKPTKKDAPKGKCQECGGWHGLPAVHLSYVGHAALTDRLLDVDPAWSWEPLSVGTDGLPVFDKSGGLWIKLTVCGVTRMGYGNAEGKSYMDVGAREKEVIGDALRNAAMRFGAALDLWHKGDLHVDETAEKKEPEKKNGNYKPAFNVLGFNPKVPEDFPLEESDQLQVEQVVEKTLKWLAGNKITDAVLEMDNAGFHPDQWRYAWSFFDSTQRSGMKKEAARLKEELNKQELATQA